VRARCPKLGVTMNDEEKRRRQKERRKEQQRKRRKAIKHDDPDKARAIQHADTERRREKRKLLKRENPDKARAIQQADTERRRKERKLQKELQEKNKKLLDAVANGEKNAAIAEAENGVARTHPGFPRWEMCPAFDQRNVDDDECISVSAELDLGKGDDDETTGRVPVMHAETNKNSETRHRGRELRRQSWALLKSDNRKKALKLRARYGISPPTVKELGKELRRLSWAKLKSEDRKKTRKLRKRWKSHDGFYEAVWVYNPKRGLGFLVGLPGGTSYRVNDDFNPRLRKKYGRLRKVKMTEMEVTPAGAYYGERFFGYPPADIPRDSRLGDRVRVLIVSDPYRTQKRLMHLVATKKRKNFAKLGPREVFERWKVREAERIRHWNQAKKRGKRLNPHMDGFGSGDTELCKQRDTVPMRMCVSTVEYQCYDETRYMVSPQEISKLHY